jgi:hypothetical protein
VREAIRILVTLEQYPACKMKCVDAVGFSVAGNIMGGIVGVRTGTLGIQVIANCLADEVCFFGYVGGGGGVASGTPAASSTIQVSRVLVWGTGKKLGQTYREGFFETQVDLTAGSQGVVGGVHASGFYSSRVGGVSYGVHSGVGASKFPITRSVTQQGQWFEGFCMKLP